MSAKTITCPTCSGTGYRGRGACAECSGAAYVSLKYFVDCLTPEGWRKGSIAWPAEDAQIVAAGFREEHPDWLVEINPTDTSKA